MNWEPKRPLPVFPLPGVVLFPGAEMKLHVFELRYRTMVRDALSDERVFALATLAPGWEQDYHGSPPFHGLGCAARIEEVEWLPNDRYDLRVRGILRVRLERARREYPYRACDAEALTDAPYTEDDPLAELARRDLLAERQRLAPLGAEAWLAPPTVSDGAPLTEVTGVIATCVRLPCEEKLDLLTEDRVPERARRLCECMRRMGPSAAGTAPPPDTSPN
jgi:Lon protease-like protein